MECTIIPIKENEKAARLLQKHKHTHNLSVYPLEFFSYLEFIANLQFAQVIYKN